MSENDIADPAQQPPAPPPPIPPLKVQRMGKLFRIVYAETRNLAKFNSGKPVDDGGFEKQEEAWIHLSKVKASQGPTQDPEEEGIG